MTNSSQTLLRELGKAYAESGFEDPAGWHVHSDAQSAADFRELSAHGLVEPFNGGWRWTSAGLRVAMTSIPTTEKAKAAFREMSGAYIQAGSPAPEGWYFERAPEVPTAAFAELQSRGILRPSGTGYQRWFLTAAGVQAIRSGDSL